MSSFQDPQAPLQPLIPFSTLRELITHFKSDMHYFLSHIGSSPTFNAQSIDPPHPYELVVSLFSRSYEGFEEASEGIKKSLLENFETWVCIEHRTTKSSEVVSASAMAGSPIKFPIFRKSSPEDMLINLLLRDVREYAHSENEARSDPMVNTNLEDANDGLFQLYTLLSTLVGVKHTELAGMPEKVRKSLMWKMGMWFLGKPDWVMAIDPVSQEPKEEKESEKEKKGLKKWFGKSRK